MLQLRSDFRLTVEVVAGEYCEGEVVIPSQVKIDWKVYVVSGIGSYAFHSPKEGGGSENMTTIEIASTVTYIGRDAFVGSGLTSISIPSSVTEIGIEAFGACMKLNVYIDNYEENVSVGYDAFRGCVSVNWKEQEDSHESVDLGLPSGLKWATMNVGASKPEEFGDYFAWGEVAPAPNNDYSLGNSRFTTGPLRNPDSLKTHGIVDEYGNLTDDYDAATVNWGKNWRMPSKSDYYELIEYCTWTWMKMNDIYGYKVESKSNSNWIFLPTAGYRTGTSLVNESCYYSDYSIGRYWSSSVYIFGSNALYFNDKTQDIYGYDRDSGYSVRPVAK